MKRIDLWRGKLKAAKAQQRIVIRQYNMAEREMQRLSLLIETLEGKIGNVEKHKRQAAHDD